jgi:hypothetical protein
VLHTQFKPPVLGCHAANPNRTRAPAVSRTAHQNLLSLQARAASDDTTSAVLKQSAARVHTIAAIHDRLYRSGSALQVEIAPYLQGLIEDLQGALGSDAGGRHIQLSADMAVWPASDVPTIGGLPRGPERAANPDRRRRGGGSPRFRPDEEPRARDAHCHWIVARTGRPV